jgi:hypothetical protein
LLLLGESDKMSGEDLQKQLEELQARVKFLDEENALLKNDIDAADRRIEELTARLEQNASASNFDTAPVNPPNPAGPSQCEVILTREGVLQQIRKLMDDAMHSITLCIPSVLDIRDLDLHAVRSNIIVKIACNYEPGNAEHKEIISEFQMLENVSFRVFDSKDHWSVIKDGDALFLAVLGKNPGSIFGFLTHDPLHIKFFNSLVMESWLRGRKIMN